MHSLGQAKSFIEKVFGQGVVQGNNVSVLCPKCVLETGERHKKKLSIRMDNWLAQCWVCGLKTRNIITILKRYNTKFVGEYQDKFGNSEVLNGGQLFETSAMKTLALPSGYVFLANLDDLQREPWFVKKVLKYLGTRGCNNKADLWKFKLGATPDYRVVVPSFDVNGELNYWVARTVLDNIKPPYTNLEVPNKQVVFNELGIDWTSRLTLVEGVFDWMKVNENSVPLLGKQLCHDSLLFRRIVEHRTSVLLALDRDAWLQTRLIAQLLLEYEIGVSIVRWPSGVKDPGSLTDREDFKRLADNNTLTINDSLDLIKMKLLTL